MEYIKKERFDSIAYLNFWIEIYGDLRLNSSYIVT